jgi:diguanylate cyclase (GGDEF)-like protein/PAS domain S-box-containing protein
MTVGEVDVSDVGVATWALSDRYRTLFDHAPIAIWVEDWSAVKPIIEELRRRNILDFDRYFRDRPELVSSLSWDLQVLAFNAAAVSMYGAPDEKAMWEMVAREAHADWEFRTFCITVAAFARGETRFAINEWKKKYDGSPIYVCDTVFVPDEFHKSWLRVVRTTEDITAGSRAERALRESEQRLQDLYDNAPDMYFTIAGDGSVLSANKFGAEYLGYRAEELVGREYWHLIDPDERARVRERIQTIFAHNKHESEFEFRKRRRDGSVVWVHGRFRLAAARINSRAELRLICRDVTQARVLGEKLSHQASHDALTGLVNRREFESRLKRVLETTKSSDTEHALCYLDLDQLKIINDTCGHSAGDELLRQLTAELQACIRKRDTLARLGGDEFGVLIEHCSLDQAQRVAEALRSVVEEFRFRWEDKAFNLGVSIGLVPIGVESDSLTSVLRAADTACYAAKDEGRNRVHVFHQDDTEMVRRFGEIQWVARLNRAMECDQLTLYWQRIVPIDWVLPCNHNWR